MEFHKQLINKLEYKYGFSLESLEKFWNVFKDTVDKPVAQSRLQNAAAFQAHSPELISRDQFKWIMVQQFNIQDVALTNGIFMVADAESRGALDVRELLGNMIFWLRGDHAYKWALFFEVFSSSDLGNTVSADNVNKVVTDAVKIFKETFFLAKTACDKMNTDLNGKITFEQFNHFCLFNPEAIDFIARLTLGPYPPSEELQNHLASMQRSQSVG